MAPRVVVVRSVSRGVAPEALLPVEHVVQRCRCRAVVTSTVAAVVVTRDARPLVDVRRVEAERVERLEALRKLPLLLVVTRERVLDA